MNLAFGCPLEHVHLARIGWGSCLDFGSLRVQNAAAHGGWKNLSQLLPLKNWCVAFGAKKADASQPGKQSESQLFWSSSPSGDTARKQTFHGTVFDLPTWRNSGSWWNEHEIHHDWWSIKHHQTKLSIRWNELDITNPSSITSRLWWMDMLWISLNWDNWGRESADAPWGIGTHRSHIHQL